MKPDDLRLHPKPVHTFRRQVYHCFNAVFYAANDVLAWAVAPVSACVKSIENRCHTLRAIKGTNEVIAIWVMQRVTKRNNFDSMTLVYGNADFLHDIVKSSPGAFA